MDKIRVYELARELDTNSKRLMEKLAEIGVIVKNHMSLLEDDELDSLYKHIGIKAKTHESARSESVHTPHEQAKPPATQAGAAESKTSRSEPDPGGAGSGVGGAAGSGAGAGARGGAGSGAGAGARGGASKAADRAADKAADKAVDKAADKAVYKAADRSAGKDAGGAVGGAGEAASGAIGAGKDTGGAAGAAGTGAATAAKAGTGAATGTATKAGAEAGTAAKAGSATASGTVKSTGAGASSGAAASGAAASARKRSDAPHEKAAGTAAAEPQKAAGQVKDAKSAPRIIRTTEINLDRTSGEGRDGHRQQTSGAQQGAGRYGGRGERREGGRGSDRDRRRQGQGYDRSEYYKTPDQNAGLIAGFTRMTREESMKQLLAEARAQKKRAAVMDESAGKGYIGVKPGAKEPQGREDAAAKTEKAARIDRLTRIDSSVKAEIVETADTIMPPVSGSTPTISDVGIDVRSVETDYAKLPRDVAAATDKSGGAPAMDVAAGGVSAAGTDRRADMEQPRQPAEAAAPYGVDQKSGVATIADVSADAAGDLGAADVAAARKTRDKADVPVAAESAERSAAAKRAASEYLADDRVSTAVHPVTAIPVPDAAATGDITAQRQKPPATERSAAEHPTAERPAAERPAIDRAASDRVSLERPAGDRAAPDRSASDRASATDRKPISDRAPRTERVPTSDRPAGERPPAGADRPAADRPAASERAGADRTGADRTAAQRQAAARPGTASDRSAAPRTDSLRPRDGRTQPKASFDGRSYQQDQGRPGQSSGDAGQRQDGSYRRTDGGARPTDYRSQQRPSAGPTGSTGARPYQQDQSAARRDGRPFGGARDDRPFRPRDDRAGTPGGDRGATSTGARTYPPRDGRPYQPRDDRPFQPRERSGQAGDRPYSSQAGGGSRPGGYGASGGAPRAGGYGSSGGGAQRAGGYGASGGGAPRAGQYGASGDRRPGGAGAPPGGRQRGPAAQKTDSFTRADDTSSFKNEQKRVYSSKDAAKEVKKDLKRETAKPTAATVATSKSRKYRAQPAIVGDKKGVQAFSDDEFIISEFYDASDESKRSRRQQKQRRLLRKEKYIPPRAILTSVTIPEVLTVKELAEALKKTAGDVIKKLIGMGMVATINEVLDFDTAALIAGEFGIAAEKETVVNEEDILFDDSEAEDEGLVQRPPVVVVMGHVDHGKTSLLDMIRKTNVIASEAGGITQHIGAYMVNINGRAITFLDTPGHEAFTSMRARGAMVTDIAILVVSAVDGIMPQTVEAINHARAANVSIIIAINMIDREGADVERVKQELTEHNIVVEEWGGDVIAVPVSAKTGENIEQLLEMVLLTADVLELKANPNRQAKGTVIEAKLDKNRGPVATLLVQRGTLNVGDSFITGATVGRIRAMLDDNGKNIQKAGPSTPVEIIGLSEMPEAGEVFYVTTDDKVTKSLAEKRRQLLREETLRSSSRVTLDDLFSQIKEGKVKELNIIIKADVQGSVEAVRQSLEKLGNEEVRVNIIHSGVGSINESDVSLASVSNAIIIGFNVRPGGASVIEAAETLGIDIRLYTVIYNAIEDIQAAMKGLLDPTFREVVLGHVEIRQIFRASGIGTIGGCYVLDGKIQRGNSIRILRDGVTIHDGKLASLRRFKDDAREVMQGFECGIAIERFNDIKENDIIEPYVMEEVPAN